MTLLITGLSGQSCDSKDGTTWSTYHDIENGKCKWCGLSEAALRQSIRRTPRPAPPTETDMRTPTPQND